MIKISTFKTVTTSSNQKYRLPSDFFPESIFDLPSNWGDPLCVSFWSSISEPTQLQEERAIMSVLGQEQSYIRSRLQKVSAL